MPASVTRRTKVARNRGSLRNHPKLDDVMSELETQCGVWDGYPFEVDAGGTAFRAKRMGEYTYTNLLLILSLIVTRRAIRRALSTRASLRRFASSGGKNIGGP